MALTFADTHNMIAYLTKSDASEGFDQIIDFLNASTIQYALTVNPNIYVSGIKQFWSSISVKKVNDVIRLQALIDRKKVIITEATVREALRLDDAKSIDCLPNEEIFTELLRMGYEKPSTKLTFYKEFFSQQWKFLIHTILQCMSAKRKSWNEFSSSMASAVIFLSTGRKINFSKYIFDSLVRNVDSSLKFYMYLRFLQLMIRAQERDFSRVETPLFESMIVAHQADDVADEVAAGVDIDDVPAANAEPILPSPTPTTQPPPSQELPSTSHVIPTPPPSLIAEPSSPPQPQQPTHDVEISMDLLHTLLETYTTLTRNVKALEKYKVAQALEIIKLKHRVKKLERKNKLKVSGLRRLRKVKTTQRVESSTDTVMDDQEDASKQGEIIANIDVDKDVTLKDVTDVEKTAEIEKDADLEEEESRALKRISESLEEKVAKKQKLDEEVEELKKRLQIVPNDNDVYTKATPLALKVPIVDYAIYIENNKPYYKIIRANGSHQLFLIFLSLLRNFDREDLEVLWQLVKERFASSKPKNFSDDFLLTTLTYMFEKPDVQAQMILLVERRYLLTRFILDQMLNNVRLEVEEESEVSLKLLRFVRQQQEEGFRPE
nr:hypothetical protein [Tanacetum cinerariifolium]